MKTIRNELMHWIILSIPIIYLANVYPTLPNIIPTHFHGNGIPDDYSHKTLLLWLVPVITIGIYLLFFILTKIIWKGKNQKRVNIIRLIINIIICALAVTSIYISQPWADSNLGTGIIDVAVAIIFIPMILYTYFLIKALSQVVPQGESPESYKWGIFYYNPGNPKIWVPKRYGMGWTLNMAHPVSYLIFAILIAIIIGTIFISK